MPTPTFFRAVMTRHQLRPFALSRYLGFSLIEVLVALVITLVGLLGLTGLIVRANQAEMESYQRVQALLLLQDMVDRINANRQVAACYSTTVSTGKTLGTSGTGTLTCTTGTTQQNAQVGADLTAWNNLLLGSAEVETTGSTKIGAMIGARGCIVQVDATKKIYAVSVAWQGLVPTAAPGNTCGKDQYGSDDKFRRVVAATLRIGILS